MNEAEERLSYTLLIPFDMTIASQMVADLYISTFSLNLVLLSCHFLQRFVALRSFAPFIRGLGSQSKDLVYLRSGTYRGHSLQTWTMDTLCSYDHAYALGTGVLSFHRLPLRKGGVLHTSFSKNHNHRKYSRTYRIFLVHVE
jgi:hypothetical protein